LFLPLSFITLFMQLLRQSFHTVSELGIEGKADFSGQAR
jgi:hypothetical protein